MSSSARTAIMTLSSWSLRSMGRFRCLGGVDDEGPAAEDASAIGGKVRVGRAAQRSRFSLVISDLRRHI